MTIPAAFAPVASIARNTAVRSSSETSSSLLLHPTATPVSYFAGTSSSFLADTAVSNSFEPVLPSPVTLVGMGAVVVLSVIAAIVWNEQVVPISRTKLAISKKRGAVKDYLDELDDDEGDDRKLEQWLFTDWLQGRRRQSSSLKKEPALPILKNAKWNSGDNPVVVTSALLMVGILIAAITERVIS